MRSQSRKQSTSIPVAAGQTPAGSLEIHITQEQKISEIGEEELEELELLPSKQTLTDKVLV